LQAGQLAPPIELDVRGAGVGHPSELDVLKVLGADTPFEDNIADGLTKDGFAAMADKELVEGATDVMTVAFKVETPGITKGTFIGSRLGESHPERL
jgi:hypothetical protein